MKLNFDIYSLEAPEFAPNLLGMYLCRNIEGTTKKFEIIETEAYYTENDTACHAHKGYTDRTKVLYEQGGIVYVYLCYGIHYMLNVVSGKKGIPQAVLIRGVEGFDGPGKLTKGLMIDKSFNGEDLIKSEKIWIEDNGNKVEYIETKRIGIDYATEEYRNKLWRFVKK